MKKLIKQDIWAARMFNNTMRYTHMYTVEPQLSEHLSGILTIYEI